MNQKHFCAAPWSSLSMDPDGFSKLCPISQDRTEINQFSDVKTNSKFIEIRQSFIDDQQHTNCTVCWEREKNSSSTELDNHRSMYQAGDFYSDLNNPTAFKLQHLDLRWSNTCNLNCVYCGPVFSSKWANLLGIKQSFRIMPEVSNADIKTLTFLKLAGGEPFLIKENEQLLKKCLDLNPDISIEVTTNLTALDNNIYRILREFNNVRFVISFESTEQRFEYIRNGAIWEKFRKNLDQVTQDFKHIDINMVYFPLSAGGISSAITIGQMYTSPENIYIVSQNGGHGFDNVSVNALQYLRETNNSFAETLPIILKQRLLDQVNLMNSLRNETILPNYNKFDQQTSQNHKELFKELYQ